MRARRPARHRVRRVRSAISTKRPQRSRLMQPARRGLQARREAFCQAQSGPVCDSHWAGLPVPRQPREPLPPTRTYAIAGLPRRHVRPAVGELRVPAARRDGSSVAGFVRLRKRSSPGSPPTSWLLCTSTGSLVDGVHRRCARGRRSSGIACPTRGRSARAPRCKSERARVPMTGTARVIGMFFDDWCGLTCVERR
jgi:hypothetical protein